MKQQEISPNPAPTPSQPSQSAKAKPAKNLYEPYSTPRVLYEFLRYLIRFAFLIVLRVRLRGLYNIPRKGPYIIAANHLSWMDIPLVPAYVPGKVVYMAKEELFASQVGWLVRFLGAFPVKRGEGDRLALRAAGEQLKQGRVLIIFPEGTRSKTGTLNHASPGLGMIALRAGVPVIPVAISGSEHALKRFAARVTVTYGEPVILKPRGAKMTREDMDEATAEVMHRIAAMLPARYRGVYADVDAEATEQPALASAPPTEVLPE